MLLENSSVRPALPVYDMERAKSFYQDKLGLKLRETGIPEVVIAMAGQGTTLSLNFRQKKSDVDYTVAVFMVDDLDAAVKAMKAKGVVFEEYNTPNLKTVGGIANITPQIRTAWFKDSEGNLLAVSHQSLSSGKK